MDGLRSLGKQRLAVSKAQTVSQSKIIDRTENLLIVDEHCVRD